MHPLTIMNSALSEQLKINALARAELCAEEYGGTEVALDKEIRRLVYADELDRATLDCLLQVLQCHPNADIKASVLLLLAARTVDEQKSFLFEAPFVEAVVAILPSLDESDPIEEEAVFDSLCFLENFLFAGLSDKNALSGKREFLDWLVGRSCAGAPASTRNQNFAAEILSQFLVSCDEAGAIDRLHCDKLLTQLENSAVLDEEYQQNIFDVAYWLLANRSELVNIQSLSEKVASFWAANSASLAPIRVVQEILQLPVGVLAASLEQKQLFVDKILFLLKKNRRNGERRRLLLQAVDSIAENTDYRWIKEVAEKGEVSALPSV